MHKFYTALFFLLAGFSCMAQPYTVGTQTLSWPDPARSNRAVGLEFRYPGTNTALANGTFPFVIFAHGFQMNATPYYPYADSLAVRGYVVGLLTTETSLSPSHPDFAQDLVFAYNKLISEATTNSNSPFYQKVLPKGALGGHSMGGGCTVLSAQYGNPAQCYFTFAAANTNPASIPVAPLMTKPYLSFAGSADCITPIAAHQKPMYDSSGSPCKVLINIKDALHCQFGAGNFQCNFGETFSGCASSPLSRSQQINTTLHYLIPFLDYYLKGNCTAWTLFENRYNSNTTDVLEMSCNNTVPTNAAINGNTTYCSGGSTTLTAQPSGFNYTWSNNSTADTLPVSSPGNYSVVVGNGVCSLPAITVTVTQGVPPLAPTTITADDTVCSGIANIPISTPSDTAVQTYNWQVPAGWVINQGAGTASITVTSGNSSGLIEVTAENQCGASAPAQISIQVVPSGLGTPGAINGDTVLCQGTATAYSIAPVSGADSYVWTFPAGWPAGADSTYTATTVTSSGIVSVQAQNSCGQSPAASVYVTVNTAPDLTAAYITGPDTVCANQSNVLSYTLVNAPGNAVINWQLPTGWAPVSGDSTATPTISINGTGTLNVTAANSCGTSAILSFATTLADTPAVQITPNGATLQTGGGNAYQWYLNDTLIPGANGNSYTPNQSGNYQVVATNSAGCSSVSNSYYFTYTGLSTIAATLPLRVYPNPTNGKLFVSNGTGHPATVTLLGTDGRLVYSTPITQQPESIIQLPNTAPGLYVVQVQSTLGTYSGLLSVQ